MISVALLLYLGFGLALAEYAQWGLGSSLPLRLTSIAYYR